MPDKRRDEEQLPPIPDGGLSESMPEWLRRPPAWRTLPDADVVHPEPERSGDLPEADTSVIDPRTFLTDEDLPEWLRRFGASARSGETEPPETERQSDEPAEGAESERPAVPVTTVAGPVAASRFIPRAPVVVRASDEEGTPTDQEDRSVSGSRPAASIPEAGPRRGPVHRAAWWQGPQLAILLAVALVIALIVIAILVIWPI